MASHGGARNRSGPSFDPQSARSERNGVVLTALPNEGRSGEPPLAWPLGRPAVFIERFENGKPVKELDEQATAEREAQELAMWDEVWSYPQAVAWELEPWRWNIIALYVRTFLVCAGPEAKAADKASLHRFGDQIGLTPAGMRENGWAIAQPDISAVQSSDQGSAPSGGKKGRPERRMRAV